MTNKTTDRSRIVAYQNCPQLRYLNYEWDGTGLEPLRLNLPIEAGIAAHAGFSSLLRADFSSLLGGLCDEENSRALALKAIQCAIVEHEPEVVADDPSTVEYLIAEQRALVGGVVAGVAAHVLPELLEEHDILDVEREVRLPFLPGLDYALRFDAVLRRKSDGALVILEWKTTSDISPAWVSKWQHNVQMLAYLWAARQLYPHEEVVGILIIGAQLGSRTFSKTNQRTEQHSPLCYAYCDKKGGWTPGYKAGATKVPVWNELLPADWWERAEVQEAIKGLFCTVPLICPADAEVARWLRQATAQEHRVQQLLEDQQYTDIPLFPMHDEHCHRYASSPCPYIGLCFNPEGMASPLQAGFRRRVTHHGPVKDGTPPARL